MKADPIGWTESTLIIGPVAWGGVWGHGPELARFLAGKRSVEYLDPLQPPGQCAPSFSGGDSYPLPAGVRVQRRKSVFRPGLLYGLEMEWKNFRAARRSKAGTLITYYPLGSLLALAWFRFSRRRALFVYADFPDILRHRLARLLARALGLRLSAALAGAGSLATSRLLYEDLGRVTRRRFLVPNGVNREDIPPELRQRSPRLSDAAFTVGFVGFFGEWVDLECVVETAARLPDVRFVLVGEGPARARLGAGADSLPNLIFTGRLPRHKVFGEIARMDLCLVPFRVNAVTDRVSPVKLFEYWALGKPVLASPCLELKLLAREEPGALELFTDSRELVARVQALRDNPERCNHAAECARKAAERFDWRILGEQIDRLLKDGTYSVISSEK